MTRNRALLPMLVIAFAAALLAGHAAQSVAQPKTPPAPAAPGVPAPAAAGAPAPSAAPESAKDITMMELFMKGGFFMWPILGCSIVGLVFILERLASLRKSAIIPASFFGAMKGVYRDPVADREAALQFCRSQNTPIARIVAAGIGKQHRGPEVVEKAIEDAGANEVSKLKKNLRIIYTVASISPLLGLIGTISGMITAFQVTSDIGTGSGKALATGIYEALVTTYAGLLVAIPAVAMYHFFQGKIERLVSDMNSVSTEFVEHYVDNPGLPANKAA